MSILIKKENYNSDLLYRYFPCQNSVPYTILFIDYLIEVSIVKEATKM